MFKSIGLAMLANAALVAGRGYEGEPDYYAEECPTYHFDDNLDTPEYQALSAKCKQDIIWDNCISNRDPERFFIGKEFQPFFN